VFLQFIHSNRRAALLASGAIVLFSASGCTNWSNGKKFLNPNTYRDERAVDIEKRLDRTEPIVKNPF